MESLLEGFAEYFSAELSEKVIRGMTENVFNHKFNGGKLPVGYYIDENQQYQIDVKTAPYVKDAFVMYASNFSMKEIAEYLRNKGVRTSNNEPISLRSMSNMLRNRKYIGEYKYRDIVIPDGIPQIVPVKLFDDVQKKLEMKRRNSNPDMKQRYILSSKLRCGKCNSPMCGESGTSKTGKVYHYYKCSSVKRHLGCDMKSVRQEDIEKEKADLEMQIEIEKEKVSKLTLTEEQIRYWYSNILVLLQIVKSLF